MVNLILKYIKQPLTAYLPFVTKVDAPVYRISTGEIFYGVGSEKENVSISDNIGKGLYIRQIQPEQAKPKKKFTSCDSEYEITARCKAVFYSFSQDEFVINPDKVSARIIGALKKVSFNQYTGSAKEITIDILSASTDFEKIFTEETGKQFDGDNWPVIVSVEFNLNYEDISCVPCDIDDNDNPITWEPDLTPESCETKAICEVISKCDVITLLQEQTASLQEQIDNLPQSGLTCADLPNCQTIIDILQSISDIISGLPSSYFSCADLEFCQTIIDIVSDISALQTQVGTNTTNISTLQGQVSSLISDLGTLTTTVNNHISNTSNPHQVTLEQARSQNSSISGDINANSNTIINLKDAVNPQEPITKMQFDTYVSAVGGQRGSIDCSLNPNYPASNKGDRWEVTVAGKIGGALGIDVQVYDEIVCKVNSVAGDQATVGANFYVVQGNLERATETTSGYIQLATDVEVQAGTDNEKAVTSLKLANWWTWIKTQAQTFAAKITFTTAPRFNSTTANQRLEVDANKDLISVAKGTADNASYGVTAGTVAEGNDSRIVGAEQTSNKVSTIIGNETDVDKYPNTKGVYDYVSLFLSGGTTDLGVVISQTNTPPGSPVTGDRYLIGSAPTGTWVGNANSIAEWNGAAWVYTVPVNNNTVFVTATLTTLRFDGSSWIAFQGTAIIQNGNLLGSAMNIGTNDNFSLNFKINGSVVSNFDTSGRLIVGTGTPISYSKATVIDSVGSGGSAAISVFNKVVGGNGLSTFTARSYSDANAFAYFAYTNALSGNFSGTSVPGSSSLLIDTGSSATKSFFRNGTVIYNVIGTTSTNNGSRLDSTGFRIGTLADIHTANTNPFEVRGKFHHDTNHNVVVGSAALATSATNGFFYIPTCAGTPTGVPTAKTGRIPMVYDSTNNKFYMYNGGWKSVALV